MPSPSKFPSVAEQLIASMRTSATRTDGTEHVLEADDCAALVKHVDTMEAEVWTLVRLLRLASCCVPGNAMCTVPEILPSKTDRRLLVLIWSVVGNYPANPKAEKKCRADRSDELESALYLANSTSIELLRRAEAAEADAKHAQEMREDALARWGTAQARIAELEAHLAGIRVACAALEAKVNEDAGVVKALRERAEREETARVAAHEDLNIATLKLSTAAGERDGLKARVKELEQASPDDLRRHGWAVAVHNDYRLAGVPHTFWLLTKDDRCLKGEGKTDAEALNQIRSYAELVKEDDASAVSNARITSLESDNARLREALTECKLMAEALANRLNTSTTVNGPDRDAILIARRAHEALNRDNTKS